MRTTKALACLLASALFSLPLAAQTMNTGTFLGAVRDQSGAAVPSAQVRIERVNPPMVRAVETNAEGDYTAQQIPVGEYRITFEKTGFQRSVKTGIQISAGQSLRVDEVLNVGAVTETVEVDAKVAQVDTATANVGSTVYGDQVRELALNTRSFSQLMTLQPGVSSSQAQQPGFGSNTSVPFSFNGGQTSANNWTLDGSRNLDPYNGNNMSMVNLDAIAEVRIERNAYVAEYGRNSGAQVNVITKSGTNEWHGTAFEFFRNDKLDARNFFAKARPKNRYNNFGWTLGGPIKRDKLFFFASNEYRRIWQNTSTRTSIVPTAANLQGDFSAIGRTVRDPLTGVAFPNNQIPVSRLDPNSLLLVKTYYAQPTPGYQVGALNFTSSAPDGTEFKSGLLRLDAVISPRLTMFLRYSQDGTRLFSPYGLFAGNAMANVAGSEQSHIPKTANFTMNWIPSASVVNTLTVAQYHLSMAISQDSTVARSRAAGLNIPRVFDTQTASGGYIPAISMSQGYAGIDIRWPQNLSGYTFEVIDNVSIIKGRHNFKFGGSLMRENKSQNNSNPNNNGSFSFNAAKTGDALADFLMGKAFSYSENSNHVWGAAYYTNYAFYAQDQWRPTSRLSLNYGVRWEFFQPEREQNDTLSFFAPWLFDPTRAAQVQSNGQIVSGTENFDNGVVLAGASNNPYGRAIFNTTWNTFAPRGGFSYLLSQDGNTVVRGGFGMFHDRWSQYVSGTRTNWPLNQNASIYNTEVSNPAGGERRLFPIGMTSFSSPWNIPYMMKWSLGIQHQFAGGIMVDTSYVGSRGINLIRTRDINQIQSSVDVAAGRVSANALRPYLGLAGINTYQTDAQSVYHSLQVAASRRFSRGFSVQASYTLAKTIDNAVTPTYNSWDSRLDRAVSGFDRRHVFVASYVYELPFFASTTGVARRILHGWQLSGITRMESGLPLTVSVPGDRAGIGGGSQRPNQIAMDVDTPHTLQRWFDPSAFATPALGTFGNTGRNILRGPGFQNWDVSVSKWFGITEAVRMQFRGEFFNIWNHTQWAGVSTSLSASTVGQVTSARDPRITQLGLRLVF